MICVLSLIVFSILGIFSATHRRLALEAFDCVKNRAKMQPCDTRLDDRVQASVVGKVLDYSPSAAKFLNKYFEVFSWVALILLVVSGLSAGVGAYNYAVHGNCNGPAAETGCAANTLESQIRGVLSDIGVPGISERPEVHDMAEKGLNNSSGTSLNGTEVSG